jgi:hypothetical protein
MLHAEMLTPEPIGPLAAGVCAAFEGYIKWPAGSWDDH